MDSCKALPQSHGQSDLELLAVLVSQALYGLCPLALASAKRSSVLLLHFW